MLLLEVLWAMKKKMKIDVDPGGSDTGRPEDIFEIPVQAADDL